MGHSEKGSRSPNPSLLGFEIDDGGLFDAGTFGDRADRNIDIGLEDPDFIPVAEDLFVGDALAIEEGAVPTVVVFKVIRVVTTYDGGMVAGDARGLENDVAIRVPAKGDLVEIEIELPIDAMADFDAEGNEIVTHGGTPCPNPRPA